MGSAALLFVLSQGQAVFASTKTTRAEATSSPSSEIAPYTPSVTAAIVLPTSTATYTATIVVTPTATSIPPSQTVIPRLSETPTETPSGTAGDPEQASPSEITIVHLPILFWQEAQAPAPTPTPPPPFTPPIKLLYCDTFSSPKTIPDNNESGLNDSITINDTRQIVDIDVQLDINHTWVGDLNINLTHLNTGDSVNLIHRPGRPATSLGCSNDNIKAILDDELSSAVENKCASSPAAISGIYIPNQPLSWFDGVSIAGEWRLNVSDRSASGTGTLRGWCIFATISENPAPPTPTPPPPSLPSSRILSGITGRPQALPLDCESRSAVDWAKTFGYNIDELEFFYQLPHSDNPDKGFVGSVYGAWGQIPPNPYGVHAEPVAEVLRDYGVQAYAHRPLSWDGLRNEVANGRPVFVWIIGSIDNGIPVYYTPSDGLHTIVARYEHTVVVTGYTSNLVYYLNGGTIYTVSVSQFLDSWSALGNMAITARP